jgi:hypothetical protein
MQRRHRNQKESHVIHIAEFVIGASDSGVKVGHKTANWKTLSICTHTEVVQIGSKVVLCEQLPPGLLGVRACNNQNVTVSAAH